MRAKTLTLGTAVFGLVLIGSAAMAGDARTAQVEPADCGDKALQDSLGEPVTGTVAEDVQVGGEPVEAPASVRVVGPGDSVTMDFNPERLTLETDEDGNLVRAQCG